MNNLPLRAFFGITGFLVAIAVSVFLCTAFQESHYILASRGPCGTARLSALSTLILNMPRALGVGLFGVTATLLYRPWMTRIAAVALSGSFLIWLLSLWQVKEFISQVYWHFL